MKMVETSISAPGRDDHSRGNRLPNGSRRNHSELKRDQELEDVLLG